MFIGKNADKYMEHFRKFNAAGGKRFKFSWHWPALLVPGLWLLHRKMDRWAALAFLTEILNIFFLPLLVFKIVWAVTANYIYYRYSKGKILEIKWVCPGNKWEQRFFQGTLGGYSCNAGYMLLGVIVESTWFFFVMVVPVFRWLGRC